METLKNIIKSKGFKWFLILYGVFFVVGCLIILLTKRGDVLLFINSLSIPELDLIVLFITNLGLGSYLAVLALSLVFIRIRYAFTGLLNLALISVFTNLLKKTMVDVWQRPLYFFMYDDFSRYIDLAEINYYFTFPSGHTMAIFGTMAILSFFAEKRWAAILFFFGALLVGFSRIYLLQHFFIDVFAGAFVGVLSTAIILWLTESKFRFLKNRTFDHSIFYLIIPRKIGFRLRFTLL